MNNVCSLALALALVPTLALGGGGMRYARSDRPSIALVFDESTRTAAVMNQSKNKVLVQGSTFMHEVSVLRLDPDEGSSCPTLFIALDKPREDGGSGRVWLTLPKDGTVGPGCPRAEIEGEYARSE